MKDQTEKRKEVDLEYEKLELEILLITVGLAF